MAAIKEKAIEMLQRCGVISLSSINEAGYPRPVPMAKVKTEGISTIWMSTGLDSWKTKDFLKNPKAGVCYFEDGNSVALTGDVEVITDEKQKQEHWQDWFIAHFPKGATDPNYVLLKFQTNHATLYIDGKFIHRIIK